MTQWSTADTAGSDLTWGVGAVSRRLGVAASTLRTWERRYSVGPSHRTQGGHRRYTERDIDRVELVRRLVGRGVSAQDAARVARHLDRDELGAALSEEIERGPVDLSTEDLVDAVMAAVVTGDEKRLDDIVGGLLGREDFLATWRGVLSPALSRMACESAGGALDVDAERAATALIIRQMRTLNATGGSARPKVLLASGVEDPDCLPFLAVSAALGQASVSSRSFGPADAAGLTALVEKFRPDVVVLWGQRPEVEEPLRRFVEEHRGASLLRLAAAWPHEVGLSFGAEDDVVPMDVARAVGHVLDRIA